MDHAKLAGVLTARASRDNVRMAPATRGTAAMVNAPVSGNASTLPAAQDGATTVNVPVLVARMVLAVANIAVTA